MSVKTAAYLTSCPGRQQHVARRVMLSAECSVCGATCSGEGDSEPEARGDFSRSAKGWSVIEDPDLADGPAVYCDRCVAGLWPNGFWPEWPQ